MAIKIQSAEVDVAELVGARCERLVAVPGAAVDLVLFLYLLADGVWYRFFLDSQHLFLAECSGPDEAEDLPPGDTTYVDLGEVLGCVGSVIEEFAMKDGTLTIRFSGGESLVLSEGKSSVGPASGRKVRLLH
jgi:hypothetical protein